MTLPLSLFIIAQNEADRIHLPINSARSIADEIIVIDSGSTDGTQAKAEALGARVISHEWEGYGRQKRFGEEQCRNPWLLNLDADEELTPELAAEIIQLFSSGEPPKSAYMLPLYDILPGEATLSKHSHVNSPIRLYDRRVTRFSESPVHDSVAVPPGGVGVLKQAGIHHSFRSLAHAVNKSNAYTTMQVADMRVRGKHLPGWRLYAEFPMAFLKVYVMRKYALRGRAGFAFSMTHAFGRFLRIAKACEQADSNK